MIPKRFSDKELEVLERFNSDYRRCYVKPKSLCPTCQGKGTYLFEGNTYPCTGDPYGHYQARAHKLYSLSFMPREFQVLDWGFYPHDEVVEKIDKYSSAWQTIRHAGLGFEFYGASFGVGKTWAAAEVLRRALTAGSTGYFCTFKELVGYKDLPDDDERRYRSQRLREVECLVIDDILAPWGGDRHRSFFEDQLEVIIRHRTSNCLPTITTTNLTMKAFGEYFPRIHSLLSLKQERIRFTGKDYRASQEVLEVRRRLEEGEVFPIYYTDAEYES